MKKEYIAADRSHGESLSETGRAILDDVMDFVCVNNTAKTISEFSHNKAWELADFGDEITYNSVFNLFPTQVSPETLEWASQEAKAIAAERSKNDPWRLEFSDLFERRFWRAYELNPRLWDLLDSAEEALLFDPRSYGEPHPDHNNNGVGSMSFHILRGFLSHH